MAAASTALDRALKLAGIPIVGVSIGDVQNRATWRVDYQASATAQQRADGEALRLSFDPTSQAVIDAERAEFANALDNNPLVQALGQAQWEEAQKCSVVAGQTLRTKAGLMARVKALYQSLLP